MRALLLIALLATISAGLLLGNEAQRIVSSRAEYQQQLENAGK